MAMGEIFVRQSYIYRFSKEAFIQMCKSNWKKNNKNNGIWKKDLNATIKSVYEMVLPKVIHAFAGPLVCCWQEKKMTTNTKVGFRPGLKAGVAAKSRK